MSLISVIVPVYNVETYLPACVDSILSQTFQDFELILIDDGSPDACGDMCDQYAQTDFRIRVIHQKNGGLSAARNAGIDVAYGTYLTFVDSDDVISPNFLQLMKETAEQTCADIVVGSYRDFSDSSSLANIWTMSWNKNVYRLASPQEACLALYAGNLDVTVNACGKLYKTSLIGSRRFPVGRIHEDQAFVPPVLYAASSIAILGKPLYGYRHNEASITHTRFSNRRYDDIWAIDQCIAFFESQNERQIALAAKQKREIILAKYAILARKAGITPPQEYRIPLLSAIRCLKHGVSAERFEYYMGLVHPRLPLLCEYARRIEQIIKGE